MSFGTDLTKEFYKLTGKKFLDEICLFTKLQDAFINLKYLKYFHALDIIHGNKSKVEFKFNSNWVRSITPGTTKECELADMMFITYSPNQKNMRLCYMQNKKSSHNSNSRFNTNLFQLHLLSQREPITSTPLPACVFNDPYILSNAFCVFYENSGII